MPFPLPKLVKGLTCPRCLVLWAFGERRGPTQATPPWLFIAAIKFWRSSGGAAEALPSQGLPHSMGASRGCGGGGEGGGLPCPPSPRQPWGVLSWRSRPSQRSLGLTEPPRGVSRHRGHPAPHWPPQHPTLLPGAQGADAAATCPGGPSPCPHLGSPSSPGLQTPHPCTARAWPPQPRAVSGEPRFPCCISARCVPPSRGGG